MQPFGRAGSGGRADAPAGRRRLGQEEARRAWPQWTQTVIDGHVGLVESVSRLLTPEVAPMSGVERGGGTNAGDFATVGSRVTRVLRLPTVGWKPDEG